MTLLLAALVISNAPPCRPAVEAHPSELSPVLAAVLGSLREQERHQSNLLCGFSCRSRSKLVRKDSEGRILSEKVIEQRVMQSTGGGSENSRADRGAGARAQGRSSLSYGSRNDWWTPAQFSLSSTAYEYDSLRVEDKFYALHAHPKGQGGPLVVLMASRDSLHLIRIKVFPLDSAESGLLQAEMDLSEVAPGIRLPSRIWSCFSNGSTILEVDEVRSSFDLAFKKKEGCR